MGSKTGFLTISEALRQGTTLLEEAGVPAPRLTAEVLLAHALAQNRIYLFGHSTDELTELTWIHYGRYLHQRIGGKPTQYITKKQEFYGRDFTVSPDVLIPRPETEHLVDAAIQRIHPSHRVVDIGCGSGAIAVTLGLETLADLWATDISAAAIGIARQNAQQLGSQVKFVNGSLLDCFAPSSFDVIVSNPPYVGLDEFEGLQREVREHEPHIALFAGKTGLELYELLIAQAKTVLRTGGWLILELGWRSFDPVRTMLSSGWSDIEAIGDMASIPRVLAARRIPC